MSMRTLNTAKSGNYNEAIFEARRVGKDGIHINSSTPKDRHLARSWEEIYNTVTVIGFGYTEIHFRR